MIENQAVKELLEKWISDNLISGAVILVEKDGKKVCDAQYGYADLEKGIKMDKSSIFRLASMTKPVIAIATMLLVEEGKLDLDAPIEKYIPQFSSLKVSDKMVGFEDFYQADPENPSMPKVNTDLISSIKEAKLKRSVTIRDILSHSSGMGQGPVSMTRMEKLLKPGQSLDQRVKIFSETILDFQPGEHTGYSAATAFDVLGKIIEVVSGMNLNSFIIERICKPLGITDMGFELSEEQKRRVVKLYEATEGKLIDVSNSESFWNLINPFDAGLYCGSAGMLGTVDGYAKIARMLLQKGKADNKTFLKEETIDKMKHEASEKHLEMQPGKVWGLGMVVTENPEIAKRNVGKGTYGWSGAYGTHFYVDDENNLTMVLGVSRSNIGGADSELSKLLEDVLYKEFCQK